jgi:sugar-specific transcriptional regulator TrmB
MVVFTTNLKAFHKAAMYTHIFQQLGLPKNESKIYETLLKEGELSVGNISLKSKVHRRNVYDSIGRLIEKGLVFEIIQSRENRYQAVEPAKLMELVQEKQQLLESILPGLETLYRSKSIDQGVYIYRGVEGWKNYMRDILRIKQDFYCIGAKGAWMDQRLQHFFPSFIKEANKAKINYYHLFDYEVKSSIHDITKNVGKNFKFLPEGYSTANSVDIFGSHVNITSNIHVGGIHETDFSMTVIVNQQIADAFRIWFKFMYDFCPKENKKK